MSAIIPTGKHVAHRRPIRLPYMETLGFIDDTEAPETWTSTSVHTRENHDPAPTIIEAPLVDEWAPSDAAAIFVRAGIRWSTVISILVMLIAAAGASLWILHRPEAASTAALEQVSEDAHLVAERSAGLAAAIRTNNETNGLVSEVDTAARSLFNSSTLMPPELAASRLAAADAATDALEATQTLSGARAYRTAVSSLLVSPALPTDPSLTLVDDAAREFSAWQTWFSGTVASLPKGVMTQPRTLLVSATSGLYVIRSNYLEGLRAGDQAAAAAAVTALEDQLNEIGSALDAEYEAVASRSLALLRRAETSARSVFG